MRTTLAVVSDIHYASAAERERTDYCLGVIRNPLRRLAIRIYRHVYWMRDSFAHNALLDQFIQRAAEADLVVANGDYSCDSAFVGLSDDAAFASALECLQKLRSAFGHRLLATIGDHELGKMPLGEPIGGLRLQSLYRTAKELSLDFIWQRPVGKYLLIGVTATLIALPVHECEALPNELEEWRHFREQHLNQIRAIFAAITKEQRVILFCHDPTALPYLLEEEAVRARLPNIECTVIGHLHSPFVFWQSRLLCGMPVLSGLGHTPKRLSRALRQARLWKPFNVTLCPSLAGIELLKDGGYLTVALDSTGTEPLEITRHRLPRP
jgi:hypothetical protein